MAESSAHASFPAWSYVAAQFGLLIALILLPPWRWHWNPLGVILLIVATALGSWTLRHNRPGNFRVSPQPHRRGHLIMDGPYRWIRHPMYAAVLIVATACLLMADGVGRGLVLVALVIVLDRKAALEERMLSARWPAYPAYMARTWRFLPCIW